MGPSPGMGPVYMNERRKQYMGPSPGMGPVYIYGGVISQSVSKHKCREKQYDPSRISSQVISGSGYL